MDAVKTVVRRTSVAACVTAAVLSPIPLADEVALVPTYGLMLWRIAAARGVSVSAAPWRPFMTAAVAGLTLRAVVNLSVAALPGVSAVANAVSAVTLTHALGRVADNLCSAPEAARTAGLRDLFGALRAKPA